MEQKGEGFLGLFEKHVKLSASTPFVLAIALILMKYVGGEDVQRLINFVTFPFGK